MGSTDTYTDRQVEQMLEKMRAGRLKPSDVDADRIWPPCETRPAPKRRIRKGMNI